MFENDFDLPAIPTWVAKSPLIKWYAVFVLCQALSTFLALIISGIGQFISSTSTLVITTIFAFFVSIAPLAGFQKLREESDEDALTITLKAFKKIKDNLLAVSLLMGLCFLPSSILWSSRLIEVGAAEMQECHILEKHTPKNGRLEDHVLVLSCPSNPSLTLSPPPMRHWIDLNPKMTVKLETRKSWTGLYFWKGLHLKHQLSAK